jgi:nicotinate phosphoribosyltransferase
VRIDSGDLAQLSREVRRILDEAGCADVQIVASGGLDEEELAELTRAGAPIDAYGVGTRLGTSADAPTLDMAYKLVQYGETPCLKLSTGKQTLIGPKQVWRRLDGHGRFIADRISARDEAAPGPDWEPLLVPVMRDGEALPLPSLVDTRETHRGEIAALPRDLQTLTSSSTYSVELSPTLAHRQATAVAQVREREGL